MSRVVPGYQKIGEIGRSQKEFHVEGRVRHDPLFPFPDGRARFSIVQTPVDHLTDQQLRLMTIRSEGQFNTVVYEEQDRYRNQTSRNVILMNADDMRRLGISEGAQVAVSSEAGSITNLRAVAYDIARHCAAMYYPESNVLVPQYVDPKSGTPAFKNVLVKVTTSDVLQGTVLSPVSAQSFG